MIFALFIFVVPAGADVFMFINNVLVKVIDVASAGTKFLFGRLALPPGATNEWGEESLGFIFAVTFSPMLIAISTTVQYVVPLTLTIYAVSRRVEGRSRLPSGRALPSRS